MPYTLDQLAADCRSALNADNTRSGREKIVGFVKQALDEPTFIDEHLSGEFSKPRKVIYEDDSLGFCICAHVYEGAARGEPHDHGPTWAIYGQAIGETEMTDWDIVTPAKNDSPALVSLSRTYTLKPGDAHLYEPGDVHAPLRDAPTRLIRIEGVNCDTIDRTAIKKAG